MGILDYLFSNKPSIHRFANHRNIYLIGLATIACGLAWSNALMSIGQIILSCNWVIELNFKKKWEKLTSNKLIWVLLSLYLLHILGLLWTSDFDYAFKDLGSKIPLFVLPFIIGSSKKLTKNEWKGILVIYISTIFILSIASLYKYLGFSEKVIIDKRQLSIYISHIRYGLNIAFCIFLIWKFHTLFQKQFRFFLIALLIWLVTCLLMYQLYTGLIILMVITSLLIIRFILNSRSVFFLRATAFSVILAVGFYFIYTVIEVRNDFYEPIELTYDQELRVAQYTAGGDRYWHDFKDDRQENGVYINRFIAWHEVEREWGKKSDLPIMQSRDLKGQLLYHTLLRFLSSKGLKKDSVGINQLSEQEISAIEKGIANEYYLNNNALKKRIHKTFYEFEQYRKTGDADGYSFAMRLEFWKTTIHIIEKNFFWGTGTGDLKEAFKQQYIEDKSMLDEEYRRRGHNQYLTFFATFGIVGLFIFLFYLIYPLTLTIPNRLIYLTFIGIMSLSFLTEDTLETQAGVTLFAFFNSILLLGLPNLKLIWNGNVPASS